MLKVTASFLEQCRIVKGLYTIPTDRELIKQANNFRVNNDESFINKASNTDFITTTTITTTFPIVSTKTRKKVNTRQNADVNIHI